MTTNPQGNVDRLPPHSPEAEAGIIGCCLLEPATALGDAMEAVPDLNAFYDHRNMAVFGTMAQLDEERIPVDLITVQQRLRERGLLDQVGGLDYLNACMDAVHSAANLPAYMAVVREKFLLRKWLALCADASDQIYAVEGDADDLTAKISTELFKLCEAGSKTSEKTMREVVVQVHEQAIAKFRRGVKHKIGPMTGFNYLDNILPGFAPCQLIVMAARPRTGKSAMMMQIAEYIAGKERMAVAVFSLEMSAVSLGTRAIFQRAGADLTKFLNGFMADADVEKLVSAGDDLMGLPLFIDESPRLAIEDLEIRARRLKRQHGVGIFFIDYFQLLYVRNRHKQWSKSDELAECSMRLKALARELKVPIFLLAQMNREIERETHRRPRLSDLRDTGQLEQDADVIMFLWKPDLSSDKAKKRVAEILPRVPVQESWRTERDWKKNLAIILCTVEKQREGRSGEDATLVFIKPWTRFVDAYRSEPLPATALADSRTADAGQAQATVADDGGPGDD